MFEMVLSSEFRSNLDISTRKGLTWGPNVSFSIGIRSEATTIHSGCAINETTALYENFPLDRNVGPPAITMELGKACHFGIKRIKTLSWFILWQTYRRHVGFRTDSRRILALVSLCNRPAVISCGHWHRPTDGTDHQHHDHNELLEKAHLSRHYYWAQWGSAGCLLLAARTYPKQLPLSLNLDPTVDLLWDALLT